jgi:XTP/dITP diphosphohydrolase
MTNDNSRIENEKCVLIATHNEGKVAEIRNLLKGTAFRLISLAELSLATPAPDETGKTFAENALLKARYYRGLTGLLSLADDSGLEVDALDGAPGILSARYAGKGASQDEMIAKLLRELEGVSDSDRRARFVCAVAIAGENVEKVFEGTCQGTIGHVPRGEHGFGYDPVFIDRETGKTFAELTTSQKSRLSHRARAVAQACEFLSAFEPRSSLV